MNAESIARTLDSGNVTYWSRSRQGFWAKGETSGHVQRLVELRIDCDRDCLLLQVTQEGPACKHQSAVMFLYRGGKRGGADHL